MRALLGDSEPETPKTATPDAAAPAGVGRPATARSSPVPGRPGRSIDHGPGRPRRRHAGPGRLAHSPCRHPPLRYQRGPVQKVFWLPRTCLRPSRACREMRADAVKFVFSAFSGSSAWMRAPRIRSWGYSRWCNPVKGCSITGRAAKRRRPPRAVASCNEGPLTGPPPPAGGRMLFGGRDEAAV